MVWATEERLNQEKKDNPVSKIEPWKEAKPTDPRNVDRIERDVDCKAEREREEGKKKGEGGRIIVVLNKYKCRERKREDDR